MFKINIFNFCPTVRELFYGFKNSVIDFIPVNLVTTFHIDLL